MNFKVTKNKLKRKKKKAKESYKCVVTNSYFP